MGEKIQNAKILSGSAKMFFNNENGILIRKIFPAPRPNCSITHCAVCLIGSHLLVSAIRGTHHSLMKL